MKKAVSILMVSIFILVSSCTTDPGDLINKPPQVSGCDTLALSENPLFPGKVGSYWKYKIHIYTPTQKHDQDTMWTYKDFNSFGIDFGDTSFVIIDSTKREIAKNLTVRYKDYCYDVTAYTNNSLSYGSSEKYYWLYWIAPNGIYQMGAYNETDTLISKGLQMPYPLQTGDTWRGQNTYYDGENFIAGEVIFRTCVADNEKLVTPLFTTDSCYVILTRVSPGEDVGGYDDYYMYYAPNKGLICQVIKYTSSDNSYWFIESVHVEYEHFIK